MEGKKIIARVAASFAVVLAVMALVLPITAKADYYELVIEDDADLLTSDEEAEVRAAMEPCLEYGNIIFKSIDSNSYSTSSYAKNYYNGRYGSESGTLFLIDMDNRQIYVFSNGKNYRTITDSKADSITDNIYRYASNKDYKTCATEAFSQISTLLKGGKIAEPMRVVSGIVLAMLLGISVAAIILVASKGSKTANVNELGKSVINKMSVLSSNVHFTGSTRTYSPPSRSSGGGGGGGGHSGGGGGGGGHSF